jgi:hypothetical protein
MRFPVEGHARVEGGTSRMQALELEPLQSARGWVWTASFHIGGSQLLAWPMPEFPTGVGLSGGQFAVRS